MNFKIDYIIATYGKTELVQYVAQQVALGLLGNPGTKWTITSEDDFVIVSFGNQQDMLNFGKRWRALTGSQDMGKAA